jgi:hypothetical protein
MKAAQYMSEEELVQKAINILMQELGPVETSRFINLPRKKRVESVRRHRQWQKTLDKDTFFEKIFGSKG